MELHKDPEGKMQNSASQKQEDQLQDSLMLPMCVPRTLESCFIKWQRHHAHMEDRRETLTRQDACHVNHPHFESFVHQFQRDSKYQLHDQVAHDVLHTVGGGQGRIHSTTIEQYAGRGFQIIYKSVVSNVLMGNVFQC